MERGDNQRSFAVQREDHGSVPIVRVAGEIDLATVAALERELTLASVDTQRIVLDLLDCTFIDSTGISAIIRAGRLLPKADGSKPLAVVVRDQFVTRILERAGIGGIAALHATVPDAIGRG